MEEDTLQKVADAALQMRRHFRSLRTGFPMENPEEIKENTQFLQRLIEAPENAAWFEAIKHYEPPAEPGDGFLDSLKAAIQSEDPADAIQHHGRILISSLYIKSRLENGGPQELLTAPSGRTPAAA